MIEKAKLEDCKIVFDLVCDWMQRTFDYTMFVEEYEKYITSDHITTVVAKDADQVIGFMSVRIDFQLHHMAKVAEILELAVAREFRFSVVEKELLSYAVNLAKQNKCDCIETCTRRTNEKVHRFFEREGLNKSHYKLKMPLKY